MTVTLRRKKVKRVKRLLVEISHGGVSTELCRCDRKVRELRVAWDALAGARLNEVTWWRLLRVLIGSTAVPVRCVDPAPPLRRDEEVDLRPWLCDPAGMEAICEQFREIGFRALSSSRHVSCLDAASLLFPEGERVRSPYLYANHGALGSFGTLAETFNSVQIEQVLPWLKGLAWEMVPRVVKQLEVLRERSPEIAWGVLSQPDGGMVEHWSGIFLARCRGGRGSEWLQHWLKCNGPEIRPGGRWAEMIPLAMKVRASSPFDGLRFLWNAQREKLEPARVRAALELWVRNRWSSGPDASGGGGDCRDLVEKVGRCTLDYERGVDMSKELFELIGRFPSCRPFLERFSETNFNPELRRRMERFLLTAHCSRRDVAVLWVKLTEDFDFVCSFLEDLPEGYFEKGIWLFGALFWNSCQVDPDLREHLVLIVRQCRKPLSRSQPALSGSNGRGERLN